MQDSSGELAAPSYPSVGHNCLYAKDKEVERLVGALDTWYYTWVVVIVGMESSACCRHSGLPFALGHVLGQPELEPELPERLFVCSKPQLAVAAAHQAQAFCLTKVTLGSLVARKAV